MRDTRQQYTQEFFKLAAIIGTSYSEMNCWDVVKYCYRELFNLNLKQYYEKDTIDDNKNNELIQSNITDFKSIEERDFGDIILLKWNNISCHVGFYLGENKMLHTTKRTGCVIENLSKWEDKIIGYYRP